MSAVAEPVVFTLDYVNCRFNLTREAAPGYNVSLTLPGERPFDRKDILFRIRKKIDESGCFPAQKVILNVIPDEKCSLKGQDWKLFSMVLESIKHCAGSVVQLSIYNCSIQKSTFLSFLKVCVSLESLVVENSFIDKNTSIHADLIKCIPFVRNLRLLQTPEITSNSTTLAAMAEQFEARPLERLAISPFFGAVNRKDVETLVKMGTVMNLSVFPQSNFWNENDSLGDLPVQVHTDSLDVYFYFKIFRKQFLFVPAMFLLHPFAPTLGEYVHFLSAFVVAAIILPLEDLFPARFHLPIHPNHYRHSILTEQYEKTEDESKMKHHWYLSWIAVFFACFLGSLYCMIYSMFSKSWIPWVIYAVLTSFDVFLYQFYIDYLKKVVQ